AQVDAVGRGQFARHRAAGVIAQRADEGGGRTGTGAGHGLVETLAARAGHVLAGDGGAGGGQFVATPDMVDVEGADDDDRIHGASVASGYRGRRTAGCTGHPADGDAQPKCDSTPAMVAVMKVATEPPSTARRPKRARSWRRSGARPPMPPIWIAIELRSEEHTSELQSRENLVCRLLLEKKKRKNTPA